MESELALSPAGHLYFLSGSDGDPVLELLELGARDADESALDPTLVYFRAFARQFMHALCAIPELEAVRERVEVPLPSLLELEVLAAAVPPMFGAEYLTSEVLANIWGSFLTAFRAAIAAHEGTVQNWLAERSTSWSVLGRVCFHLAENKNDEDAPFAFLGTFTHRSAGATKVQHLPLARALEAYREEKEKLLSLLVPVQKAAATSAVAASLVATHELFHPLAWTADEAHRFLLDVPVFEQAGIVVRVPDWWRRRKRSRPEVRVTLGESPVEGVGMDAMLDFSVGLTLDGEPLTPEEQRRLLSQSSGLQLIKGRWVELDREQLNAVLGHWRDAERAHRNGISFLEAMRLLAGFSAELPSGDATEPSRALTSITGGAALDQLLAAAREESSSLDRVLASDLRAELRPYQLRGVRWLLGLDALRLGACLADDMGLGKTIQVIALLLAKRGGAPHLLVVPASLIANWTSELSRFAPSLSVRVVHPSVADYRAELSLASVDLVITTYGTIARVPWIATTSWDLLILDEAQAIKNPNTKQARSVKALSSRMRIALTGTPIENRLSDLWSIFDFLSPGLLGSAKQFAETMKILGKRGHDAFVPLRALIRPYVLRRLKTDRSIIADLPDKVEQRVYCGLTRVQAAHYEEAVRELRAALRDSEGMKRRGLVLSFLMRFKQLCNHPSQWLGDRVYDVDSSAKMLRLRELCEELAARQDKVLVFTQFREMTAPLAALLEQVYGRPGLVLSGSTAVRGRKKLVDAFQDERGPPFFVLSLKAGGTGLNLTAASHVIHFDRWWNPAVEQQATDRAFRIGQKKNVLVHKFVCRGTIEERIDAMITAKESLSAELLGSGGAEVMLTELSNEELMSLVALDLKKALAEG